MSSTKLTGLATVQSLYMLQVQLFDFINGDVRSPDDVKEAKKCLRQFSSLLESADWRYMGGEDVYDELRELRRDFSAKISRSAARKASKTAARAKAKTKKVTKAKPKKKVATKKKAVKARQAKRSVKKTKKRK